MGALHFTLAIPPEIYTVSLYFFRTRNICLYIQLQFLSLGGLFSYTGRPFTGARPPFPQLLSLLLSHCVFGCRANRIPGEKRTFGCRSNKKKCEKKSALLGAERTNPWRKKHFWVQSEQNPWGSSFVLLGSGLVYWWDMLYRWNIRGSYLFMQSNFQELICK